MLKSHLCMLFLLTCGLSVFVIRQVVSHLHGGLFKALLLKVPEDCSSHSAVYDFHTILCILRVIMFVIHGKLWFLQPQQIILSLLVFIVKMFQLGTYKYVLVCFPFVTQFWLFFRLI